MTHAGEERFGRVHRGGAESRAGRQETAVAIGHGERSAVAAVAGFALAWKVRGPELRGRAHAGGRFARMTAASTSAFARHEPVSAQDGAERGACRPGPWGMAFGEDRQPPLGTPSGVLPPGFDHGGHPSRGRLAWARGWRAGALIHTGRAIPELAGHPLIAGGTATMRARAALRERQTVTKVVGTELGVLVHGRWVTPGHGAPPWCPRLSSHCDPCPWTQL